MFDLIGAHDPVGGCHVPFFKKYISTVLLRPTSSEPELSLYDMGGAKQLLKISDAAVVRCWHAGIIFKFSEIPPGIWHISGPPGPLDAPPSLL